MPLQTPSAPRDAAGRDHVEAPSPDRNAYLHLVAAASGMSNELHRLLKPHGISESAYDTLLLLRSSGPHGCRASRIGSGLTVPVPDVTRLVDRLVEKQLATRSRAADDARAVTIRITARGRSLLRRLDAPVAAAHAEQFAQLTRRQLADLTTALAGLGDRFEPDA